MREAKKNPPPDVSVAGDVTRRDCTRWDALSEVGYAALKDRHELVAGDMLGHVTVQVVAATLGMAHLAQDAAVGLHCDSHGDRLDEMRVRTRRL